jgi:hypothetical protein
VSVVGSPLLSRAGVKRARLLRTRQVAVIERARDRLNWLPCNCDPAVGADVQPNGSGPGLLVAKRILRIVVGGKQALKIAARALQP